MKRISYAQNLEDVLLYRVLSGDSSRFYVDVGAWDPVGDSVTKMFYDDGWSGINIEPNPRWYVDICSDRPRDINLNFAVSDENSECKFLIDKNSGLSRLSGFGEGEESKDLVSVITVQTRTLASIFEEFALNKEISFLKIDVEGAEKQVLLSNNWSKFRPKILVVESTLPGTPIDTSHQWSEILHDACYVFAHFDGLNRYYVDSQSDIDIKKFSLQPNIFDGFVRHSDVLLDEARQRLGVVNRELKNACDELESSRRQISNLEDELQNVRSSRIFKLAHAVKSIIG